MFVQRVNPLTGHAEWVATEVADGGASPGHHDAVGDLVSGSLYLDMLTDTYRNAAYHAALRRIVKPGDTVLDIGTGTGLLAMLAAKAVAPEHGQPAQVVACEVFPPMAKLAERMVRHNGLQDNVKVLLKRSDEMSVQADDAGADLKQKVDVIVTEIFDSELLGEGLLPTMRHACQHLLKEGGSVIPARARVFGQLVESSVLRSCQLLPSQDADAAGVDTPLPLRTLLPPRQPASPPKHTAAAEQAPAAAALPAQEHLPTAAEQALAAASVPVPEHLPVPVVTEAMRELDVDPLFPTSLRPLSQPFAMFEFDLAAPPAGDRRVLLQVPTVAAGRVDALVMWWQLQLDPQGELIISTAPAWVPAGDLALGGHGPPVAGLTQGWRGHWRQCWAPLAAAAVQAAEGETLQIAAEHDDCNIRVGLAGRIPATGALSKQLAAWHSAPCSWMLQDAGRWARYERGLHLAIQQMRQSSPELSGVRAVALGDGLLPPLAAAALQDITAVTACQGSTQRLGRAVLQDCASHAMYKSKVKVMDLDKMLRLAEQQRSSSSAEQGLLLLGEPFYKDCESLLPWAHLRFWHEASILRQALQPRACAVLPCRGRLMAAGVSLPELWRTRAPLDAIGGLDMRPANALLGALGSRSGAGPLLMPVELWQCGGGIQELTERRCLLAFDFTGPVEEAYGSVLLGAVRPGDCHAVVMWMEYDLDPEATLQTDASPTKLREPDARRYGVLLLEAPLQLRPPQEQPYGGGSTATCCAAIRIAATFDASTGDVQFEADAVDPN